MNGTEKQIKWAEQIKTEMLRNVFKNGISDRIDKEILKRENAINREKSPDRYNATLTDLYIMRDAIEKQDSASWFIDNRGVLNGNLSWDVMFKKITGSDDSAHVKFLSEND